MQIKILRGTNHIGGSITEITCGTARIFIDLGAMLPPVGEAMPTPEENPRIAGLTCGNRDVDGVFFTHIHGDHIGLTQYVLPGIPLYLDEHAIKIQQVVDRYTARPNLAFRPLQAGESVVLGTHDELKVTPFFTDHSAFNANMFLIEGGDKRVLHTGDFRDHGRVGAKLPQMLEHYVGRVDALICEGTMLGRLDEAVPTENELSRRAHTWMQRYPLVFSLQSSTNIDRLCSFFAAAQRAGKLVLVDEYQHKVLQTLHGTPYAWLAEKARVFRFDMLPVIQKKGAFMPLRKSQFKLFQALARRFKGCLLYSQWAGYKGSDAGMDALLAEAGAQDYPVISAHTSGHATVEAIRKVAEITQAKHIIPMHTEHKQRFTALFSNALVLEDGESWAVYPAPCAIGGTAPVALLCGRRPPSARGASAHSFWPKDTPAR